MSSRNAICFMILVFTVGSCGSRRELVTGPDLSVLEGATLIDGKGGVPVENSVVVLSGRRILRVGRKGEFRYPEGTPIVDLSGRYIMPGFIDMHVHPHPGEEAVIMQMLLAFGVTTIRIPGLGVEGPEDRGVRLRDRIASGELIGPRVFTGAHIIDGPPKSFKEDVEVRTVAEMRAEVRRQAQLGVDLVKLYWSTPPDFVKAAVDEASRYNIQVVGHLRATSWTAAADAGINGLEHSGLNGPTWELVPPENRDALQALPFPEYYDRLLEIIDLDGERFDTLISALVENKVTVDPTLTVMQSLYYGDDHTVLKKLEPNLAPESVRATWGEGWEEANPITVNNREAQTEGKGMFVLCKDVVRRLHERGVRLSAGTDIGMPWITPGVSFHHELELLVEAGISPSDVLVIATKNGAEGLRAEEKFGTIAEGRSADLVVLQEDPIKDIRNTRSIVAVYKEGTQYDPKALMSWLK